ncbi:MAG: hypothetical protein KDD55_12210 [Bdellovibrionales bacterium]|nr:hypothetical protein [Bdellovibrionales bacterium]
MIEGQSIPLSVEADTALGRFQDKLGYQFRDLALLQLALRIVENPSEGFEKSDALEWIGDAVLDVFLAEHAAAADSLSFEEACSEWHTLRQNKSYARLGVYLEISDIVQAAYNREEKSVRATGARFYLTGSDIVEATFAAIMVDGSFARARDAFSNIAKVVSPYAEFTQTSGTSERILETVRGVSQLVSNESPIGTMFPLLDGELMSCVIDGEKKLKFLGSAIATLAARWHRFALGSRHWKVDASRRDNIQIRNHIAPSVVADMIESLPGECPRPKGKPISTFYALLGAYYLTNGWEEAVSRYRRLFAE